ncbi:hypothetical protein Cgig2_007950 [Carnegiea gigantea]|uniref:Disease resistance N-terminal domain-containing protein n=1 Tax=Carnegiea gigantea TaxID=171969 RepID=A0A9Q1KG28_9CARY|nr:hypothetical protein Cgig2_007950 [Carnegiea gigantea]
MALEALATDVIKSLGENLFSEAVKEILFAADTKSHIKNLANTKAMIEAVLLDAEATTQEGRSGVQRLELEKLSHILDKIDDLLDEKATRSELKKLAAAGGFKDKVDQGLENLGQQILDKCPKVPLVIRTIGGLLRGEEPTEDTWRAFRDGPLQNLSTAAPNVMESLKLSYTQLDPRLKLCFAYCSLFPRGWEFERDELICLWIASGYVESRYLCSFGRLPHLKFLTLERMCQLEYVENTSTAYGSPHPTRSNPRATTSAPNPLFPSLEQLELTYMPKLKGWRKIMHTSSTSTSSGKEESQILQNCGYYSAFPRLKDLDFRNVGLKVVPDEFRDLSALESLKLYECDKLKELPEWIDTLTSLKKLSIVECPKLKSLPKQMVNLTNLEELGIVACPTLEERCKKEPTDEGWPLIQHVPHVRIGWN